MPYSGSLILAADIGGTHIRLAMADPAQYRQDGYVTLLHTSKKRCREYKDPLVAIEEYLHTHHAKPRAISLAVAGPVTAGKVTLTNHNWHFDAQQLTTHFGVTVSVVNDFCAQAMALPFLRPQELHAVSGPQARGVNDAVKMVMGPGTGLGVSMLAPQGKDKWQAFAGEGGHVDFGTATVRDAAVKNYLLQEEKLSRVSAESLLSGQGIERLYRAHSALAGNTPEHKTDKEIIRLAVEEQNPLCTGVLEHFCCIFGGIAGNAALITGARGGVYITGGLIPRFRDIFRQSAFMRAFTDKAPMATYMPHIPVYEVLAKNPGLTGAAAGVV